MKGFINLLANIKNIDVNINVYVYVHINGGVNVAKIKGFDIRNKKGGAAKTTTTAITAYLLSLEGYKVLT